MLKNGMTVLTIETHLEKFIIEKLDKYKSKYRDYPFLIRLSVSARFFSLMCNDVNCKRKITLLSTTQIKYDKYYLHVNENQTHDIWVYLE